MPSLPPRRRPVRAPERGAFLARFRRRDARWRAAAALVFVPLLGFLGWAAWAAWAGPARPGAGLPAACARAYAAAPTARDTLWADLVVVGVSRLGGGTRQCGQYRAIAP